MYHATFKTAKTQHTKLCVSFSRSYVSDPVQSPNTMEALTFGFSSAMVTLLALLYAATQRIRVRARTRALLNFFCKRARPCVRARTPLQAFIGWKWSQGRKRGLAMGVKV